MVSFNDRKCETSGVYKCFKILMLLSYQAWGDVHGWKCYEHRNSFKQKQICAINYSCISNTYANGMDM